MATNSHHTHLANDAFGHVVPLLINGKEVTTKTTFDVTSPVSHHVIWKASSASVEDANKAAEAAQAAFPAWSNTKPSYRRDILIKASDILKERAEEVAEYMEIETGSTNAYAAGFNVPASVEQLRDVAGRIATSCGHIPICGEDGRSGLVLKEPYGVILGIAPWNAPYILGFRAISYALAAGNTCILKGSELSPRSFWAIGSIFTAAGLPPGVLNVLYHQPSDAAAVTSTLISHPDVKKINFTGSTATGAIIAAQAGKALKPVLMELGGKAPALVLKDANLATAAKGCAMGSFLHAGQICMSTERIIVHSSIASAFAAELKTAISTLFPSTSPAQILVSPAGVKKNKELVKDAVKNGATVLTGDVDATEESATRMRPIVVQATPPSAQLFQTESFGPTVSLLTVDSEADAIRLANNTEYGLSSSVFTEDLRAGLRVARQIETGAVHINNMSVHDEPVLPHGGAKKSGWGRFNGTAGLEEFLRSKTVTWAD